MADNHIVELPKFVWVLKIVQLPLAVLVLAFCSYCEHYTAFSAPALAIFTAVFSIGSLIYYLVAVHAATHAYNWVALLVLECLSVVFWLSSFADLAALYADIVYVENHVVYYYVKRDTLQNIVNAYQGLLITAMVLSVVEFILYCVTLTFMGIGIHRHRLDGRPMVAGGAATSPSAQQMSTTNTNQAAQQPAVVYSEQPSHVQQSQVPHATGQDQTYAGV